MDSITQIAIGIATAELCFGKELKNRSFLYGAFLGTLPDLDIWFGKLFDPITAISLHRSFSHSLIFYLLISTIIGSIIFKIEKQKLKLFHAINATFLILVTHSLIDAFTTWGTQIFWPLLNRIAFKTIFVVDFFYTIPWLICLYFVFKNKETIIRKKWLKIGFYCTTAYLILSIIIKLHVVSKVKSSLTSEQIFYNEIIVKPTFSNLILWNINIKSEKKYFLAEYSLLDTKPINYRSFYKNEDLAANIKNEKVYIKLQNISEHWYSLQTKNDTLYFNDLRFGLLTKDTKNPQFAFSYYFMKDNDELKAVETQKKNKDGKNLLIALFKRILGN